MPFYDGCAGVWIKIERLFAVEAYLRKPREERYMNLATLVYEQARLFCIGDASVTQFDVVEWLVTVAWQWLALASVVIWLGTLLA